MCLCVCVSVCLCVVVASCVTRRGVLTVGDTWSFCHAQDVNAIVDVLLSKDQRISACIVGFLSWYTTVHSRCWDLLSSTPEWLEWTADAELMDLLLARLPVTSLLSPAVFPSVVSHVILTIRVKQPRFTSSPHYVVCALASARMYTLAMDVLLQFRCVPDGMRASAAGGFTVLRRFLQDLVRGDERVLPPSRVADEWASCRPLAHCALRMLEMDAYSAPLVDLGPVLRRAPYL